MPFSRRTRSPRSPLRSAKAPSRSFASRVRKRSPSPTGFFAGSERASEFPSHTQRLGEVVDGGSRDRSGDALGPSRAGQLHRRRSGRDQLSRRRSLSPPRCWCVVSRAGARAGASGRIHRARLSQWQNGSDPGRSGDGFDPGPHRPGPAFGATEQLEGRLGDKIRAIRDELVHVLAHIEAAIDFPEEGIAPDQGTQLRQPAGFGSRTNARPARNGGPGPDLARRTEGCHLRRDQCRANRVC